MIRLTTDTPNGNFETVLNFIYGKDGWAYIRHDGEHEDVKLTDWAKRQCLLRGCDEGAEDGPDDIDQRLCDCMIGGPTCPIAMAYCFASQAVHLRDRLKMYEDAMPLDRVQELAQAEKDGQPPVTPKAKTYDAHKAEAEYLLGVLWNGLHNTDGMDAKAADRVAEIAHEEDRVQPITTSKNDPLTLDELREIDGEPVWCGPYEWQICHGVSDFRGYPCLELGGGESISLVGYGDSWKAYRRKPKEG